MKKFLTTMLLCLMFLTVCVPTRVDACSDLISSMCPDSPSAYPKCSDWEPSKLGYYTSSKKAAKTYTQSTDWQVVHTEYLYKTSKNKTNKVYIKYKRTHVRKYKMHYTKGSKKYTKDEMNKVTLTKVGTSGKKPSNPYKKW